MAQYDGEIAAVDAEVGRVLEALERSAVRDRTLVVLASDHGESLGEHDYFFDHGENLFDPSLRVPLLIAGPGIAAGRRSAELASTLDIVPTLLDALKVSYPPDLAGVSLLGRRARRAARSAQRLPGQNDRNLLAAWDRRFKLVATPTDSGVALRALRSRCTTRARRATPDASNAAVLRETGASWSCSVRGSMRSS